MSDPSLSRRRLITSSLGLAGLSMIGRPAFGVNREGDEPPPNILFILADDLGYADLSVYGQTDYSTPHLDRLASEGLRFTQAYANSAVCSATRLALITGRYQYRLRAGLEEPIGAPSKESIGLPPSHPTLPSILKKAGYTTALFGKWHLGSLPQFGPLKSGYDTFFGNLSGAIDYFTHQPRVGKNVPADLYENEVPVQKAGYYTQLLSDRAAEYIEGMRSKEPFFLSLHFTAPHWPWEGPGDEAVSRELKSILHYDGGNPATYAKMVGAMDDAVGRLLDVLEKRGLAKNTLVIFTSDNGGERFSKTWPFSGQKTELLEGGLRIPAILRWPGRVAAGQVTSQVAISMDWLPTLLAILGLAPDRNYPSDGVNLFPVLTGERQPFDRTLYWRYKINAQRAARSGNWKYLKINKNEFLFDVAVDPRERANLAEKHPETFKELKAQWGSWNATMLPIPPEAHSYGVSSKTQADHYAPQSAD